MCHRVRAAQQEIQKKKYIDQMDETTAFLTVDWSQKILPQQFREGQTAYFGKKGMSLLVGSFVFKDPSHDKLISKTYMVALTKCSQSEFETLCAAQLILEQFHQEHPHITKLIKRSDNASVLSGSNTIFLEKIFADKLSMKLLMRDYSEIQDGKCMCDRCSGSAKLRLRAFMNAGNDVMNAVDIKKGVEYGGGVKGIKIAVAEVSNNSETFKIKPIPETGIGPGKQFDYEDLSISSNVTLVSSFEKYDSCSFHSYNLLGRKIPIEDYVLRIRTARFPDGSKRFNTSQYITKNQVKNQIKMLSKASTADSSKGKKRVHNDASTKENRLKKSKINSNTTLPLIEENTDDDTSDEEDTRAVESATQFEDLKQMIINSEF
ncbi:unnamed protein product [Rotaria sp. Silwood2]|nr:unnamed protein product [Rotaria sp. Silwood2]